VVLEQIEVDHRPGFADHGRGQVEARVVRDELTLQGWVVGNAVAATGVVLRDQTGKKITSVTVDLPRPDIAEGFPDAPGAATAGFQVTVRPEGSGKRRLQCVAVFADGDSAELMSLDCQVRADGADADNLGWAVVTLDEKVLVGKKGWLYLHGDTNNILGQHTGKVKMGSERLEAWRQVLKGRVAASASLEIPWQCVVVPDKEAVYPEFLPDDVVPVPRRPVHEFLEVAESVGAPVVYGLDRLLEAKGDAELYPRTDSHWNYRGAYLAYLVFCEELAARGVELDIVDEDDLEWEESTIDGGLGRKVRPEPVTGPTIRARIKRPRGRVVFDNEVNNHGRVVFCEREDPGPSCVLFGESFSDFLLPFLQETFRRLVFVHTSMFVTGVLEREEPDVVLSLPTERFLVRVPDDADSFTALQELAARKGGELPWPS
jgi:alginate O-acetyltransferase complex protein AlgJ